MAFCSWSSFKQFQGNQRNNNRMNIHERKLNFHKFSTTQISLFRNSVVFFWAGELKRDTMSSHCKVLWVTMFRAHNGLNCFWFGELGRHGREIGRTFYSGVFKSLYFSHSNLIRIDKNSYGPTYLFCLVKKLFC